MKLQHRFEPITKFNAAAHKIIYQVEQLTEAELISGMEELLSSFFNRSFPPLVSARVTGWGKDPLTRGSYSYLSNRSVVVFKRPIPRTDSTSQVSPLLPCLSG